MIGKEEAWIVEILPQNLPGGNEERPEKISQVEFVSDPSRKGYLSNVSVELDPCSNLLGVLGNFLRIW
jgi:hypothetical protein